MAPAQSKPAKATEKKAKKDKKDKKDKVEKPTKGEATSKGAKEVAVPVIVSKKRDQASPSSTTASSASAPSKRLSGKQPVTFVYGTPPGHSTNAVNSPQAASVKATDVDQSKNKKDKKEKKEKNGKKDKKEKGEKPEKPEKTGNAEKVDEPTEKQKKSKAAQNEQGLALVPVPVKRATPPEAKEPEEPETKKRKPAIRKHDAEFQKLLDALEDTSKDIPTDDQSDGHDEEDNQSDQDDEETLVLGASEYGDPSSSTSEGSDVDEEDEDDDDEQEEEDDENNEEEEDDEDEEQEAPEPKMSSSVKGPSAKPKPRKVKREDVAQEVGPVTPKEKAEDCKDDVLKDGSEARRLALSLKGVAYGDQLVDELFTHSQKMEKLYEIVSGLLAKGDTSDGKYVKFVAAYQEKAAWFEKAKAAAKALLAGLNRAKAKGKAKAKSSASKRKEKDE